MTILASLITKFPRAFSNRTKFRAHSSTPYLNNPHEFRKMTHAASIAKTEESDQSFQVNVTLRDMIKPSSPTPHHKKTVQFSIFDQLAPSFHSPIVLFYRSNPSNPIANQSKLLKNSLSKTLVHFYPLAGRILGNVSIDCTDEGVEFCEAHVSENLETVIGNPNLNELKSLLPFQDVPRHKNILVSIQVNYFSCGGMAIAACISHKIADGAASADFLKAWATIANHGAYNGSSGDELIPRPMFNAACLYPPSQHLNGISVADDIICNYKTASKRLIFDKYKLTELKSRAGIISASNNNNPSKVEVVTGFIWEQMMKAAEQNQGFTKISAAIVVTDLRARLKPAVKQQTFGNFTWHATTPPANLTNSGFPELVNMLNKAIKQVDSHHMEGLFRGDPSVAELKKMVSHEGNKCVFSSLCNFPFYEVNFGMGKPVWACLTPLPVKSEVVLMSTKCGQGVEAWIQMLEDDIAVLDGIDLELCRPDERLSQVG